ncbi:FGFR1 oncogene partner 2-like [Homarus americanus]|uniref:FGFR1 oncogene partner 2-like n=1 Tax=Homarus americanus TaxID=6706 RepID=A0A8J5JT53_HOMAM|nr:FGFR1 oncogene partner 2-like [Homarus americanus]
MRGWGTPAHPSQGAQCPSSSSSTTPAATPLVMTASQHHRVSRSKRKHTVVFKENKELRLALEEHQNVMELIMSKYRQQVAKLVTVNSKQMQPNTQEQAKGLREMLNIASLSGSLQPATSAVDAGTQTEKDSPKCEEQSTSQDQEPVEPTSLQEEEKTSLESHKNTES